jgi:hypothetical protein
LPQAKAEFHEAMAQRRLATEKAGRATAERKVSARDVRNSDSEIELGNERDRRQKAEGSCEIPRLDARFPKRYRS